MHIEHTLVEALVLLIDAYHYYKKKLNRFPQPHSLLLTWRHNELRLCITSKAKFSISTYSIQHSVRSEHIIYWLTRTVQATLDLYTFTGTYVHRVNIICQVEIRHYMTITRAIDRRLKVSTFREGSGSNPRPLSKRVLGPWLDAGYTYERMSSGTLQGSLLQVHAPCSIVNHSGGHPKRRHDCNWAYSEREESVRNEQNGAASGRQS